MSPTAYIFTIPAGIIALSLWATRKEDTSHRDFGRVPSTSAMNSHANNAQRNVVTIDLLDSSTRFDHERYGQDSSPHAQGSTLGRNVVLRPLGERASAAPDWLSDHQNKTAASTGGKKYPDISGFTDSPPPPDPLATPINSSAGYQITSDEVTKLDTSTGKIVFSKNVRLVSPQFHLESQELVVYLGKDKNTMRLMEAHGEVNVLLTGVPPEKAYRGQSSHATYDPSKDSIVLTGWPKVKGQSQEQVAASADTRMTLFSKSGRMLTEGRAQTRITKAFMDETTAKEK